MNVVLVQAALYILAFLGVLYIVREIRMALWKRKMRRLR